MGNQQATLIESSTCYRPLTRRGDWRGQSVAAYALFSRIVDKVNRP